MCTNATKYALPSFSYQNQIVRNTIIILILLCRKCILTQNRNPDIKLQTKEKEIYNLKLILQVWRTFVSANTK